MPGNGRVRMFKGERLEGSEKRLTVRKGLHLKSRGGHVRDEAKLGRTIFI